ncbi:MAG: N-acetylmuramoyl-L-alanine amidase [Lachnospiraceae bacterium]|jgi:N-acetylmuramoyl-L-alanine amidase|nr:N-acetylmuramoyl-L-alanine amidase [Lachnospiraceae bacterium]
MKINVHAGHNPDGKAACGAIGFIRESTEARRVKDAVIGLLRQQGHTVYDCTCETGTSQSDVLARIVSACNAHAADLDVSIHFNSGARDAQGNGQTTGTEVLVYDTSGRAGQAAVRVCAGIASLGFRSRGVKVNRSLYVLRRSKAPAMLIECCFVDDRDDVQLYDCQRMAEAIVYGITGQSGQAVQAPADQEAASPGAETAGGCDRHLYRVQVGAYSVKDNADRMQANLKAAGFSDTIIVKA